MSELEYEFIDDANRDDGVDDARDGLIDGGGDPSQWALPVQFDTPHEVIRASAGSGKTYQLSNRYLGLLRNGFDAEQVLATTFTRKAAGEILERILSRLANAANDDAAAKELADGLLEPTLDRAAARDMLVRLCQTLHRVAVSTIDSFFNRVASVFRYELRLPPQPVLAGDDDPAVIQLRARAIEAMLGDDDAVTFVALLRRLHHDHSTRSVTGAIDTIVSDLYETYRAADENAWRQLNVGTPLSDDAVNEAINTLATLAEAQTQKRMSKALAESVRLLSMRDWQGFLSKGPAAKIAENPQAPLFYGKALPPSIEAAYRPLVEHAGDALILSIRARTLAMLELMQRFDTHFTRLREESDVLLYADLPHRLIQYMEQAQASEEQWNSDLHFRLDTRVGHLLLDEFQDTSFEQWAVLKPFADEITATTDHSRSFFCVGDVKQAIYGWRGGRAEIFDRLRDDLHLDEDSIRRLNENWRSSQVVLDAVNHLFHNLDVNEALRDGDLYQAEAADWLPLFEDHVARRKLPGYVELVSTPAVLEDDEMEFEFTAENDANSDGDEDSGNMSSSHMDEVADRVAQLHADAKGRSVGVLVSTNRTVRKLLFLLGQRGVPVSGEGGVIIAGDPAINLIMAALRLADHPGDQVAAYALFNSPMRDALSLQSLRQKDCDTAAWRTREAIQADGYAATIARWGEALAPHCDEGSVRRLTQLVGLADQFKPVSALRVRDFIDFVEASQVEEPSAANVRVMTIHKAKGLEFDIVVLPELSKVLGRMGTKAVLVDQDDAAGVVRAVHAYAPKAIRALSPQLAGAYQQEHARRIREGLCVLYVAMTRAKHAMHLMVEPLKKKANGVDWRSRGLSDKSFAAILRAGLMDEEFQESEEGGQLLFAHGDPAWHRTPEKAGKTGSGTAIETVELPRLAQSAPTKTPATVRTTTQAKSARGQHARNVPTASPSSMHRSNVSGNDSIDETIGTDLFDMRSGVNMLRGSVMHAWFEQIEWLGKDGTLPECDWLTIARNTAAGSAAPSTLGESWLASQLPQFKSMLQNQTVRESLTIPMVDEGVSIELWRERAFAVRIDDRLVSGVFDRVVVHKRSDAIERVELIDFKTDEAAGVESPGLSAKSSVERYRLQMETYCTALCQLLGVERSVIEASLLYVGRGERCSVDALS